MTDSGNAEFLEIVGGQMAQYVGVDAILAECRLVVLKAQTPQPLPDIHRRCLQPGDACGRLLREGATAVEAKKYRWRLMICGSPWRKRFGRNASSEFLLSTLNQQTRQS